MASAAFIAGLAQAFEQKSFELFLVGGAVRDELLGAGAIELDFATNAHPEEVMSILEEMERLSVYRVGQKYGTIGAIHNDVQAEITTYRASEEYRAGSRKPDVKFGHSITEDLARRDFTINAMAFPVISSDGEGSFKADSLKPIPRGLIDPYGGERDLAARLIRAVGDPAQRFAEDPLRLLRAVRFASTLGFEIEGETWRAMSVSGSRLETISRERVAQELTRMLTGPAPATALTLLRDSELLEVAAPELMALTRMADHGPNHPLSLWDHTMRVVAGVAPDPMTRWAALLHDIGKPITRSFDANGRIRFSRHEEIGAGISETVLRSLKMSNELVDSVRELVASHMQVHSYSADWSDGAVRRLAARLAPDLERALDLARADAKGHGDTPWGLSKVDALEARERAVRKAVPRIESPLNGSELSREFDRPPGPWLRTVKDALTEEVLEGHLRYDDKESAWRHARRIVESLES